MVGGHDLSPYSTEGKPTWEESQRIWRAWVAWKAVSGHFDKPRLGEVADHYALAAITHSLSGGAGLYVGGGLEHMPAAIHLVESSTIAGEGQSRMVLRDDNKVSVELWTETHKRELLSDLSKRTNVIESAKNKLTEKYRPITNAVYNSGVVGPAVPTEEEVATNEQRIALLKNAFLPENIIPEFEAAMAEISDPNALPDDLTLAKEVLIGRLETVATGRQKALKGALTQQAIDNWAACVDMDRALAEVAKQCVLGTLAIGRADDTIWKKTSGTWARLGDDDPEPATTEYEGDDPPDSATGSDDEHYRQLTGISQAKAAFATAKAAIEAVHAENTPRWTINGTAYTPAQLASTISIAASKLTMKAHHPPGAAVEGPVEIDRRAATVTDPATGDPAPMLRSYKRPNATDHVAIFTPIQTSEVAPVVVEMTARNLCGPSMIKVRLTPPTP